MAPRTLLVQIVIQAALMSLVSSFVLMQADNTDADESEIEQRILYLVKVLQRVKQLTDEDLPSRQLDDQDLSPKRFNNPDFRSRQLDDSDLSTRRFDDQEYSSNGLEDPDLGYVRSGLIDPRLLPERFLSEDQGPIDGQKEAYTNSKNLDLTELAKKLKQTQWPIDKSYERMIDIQKKDFAILPPSSEWCRMMGFRRCRNGASS